MSNGDPSFPTSKKRLTFEDMTVRPRDCEDFVLCPKSMIDRLRDDLQFQRNKADSVVTLNTGLEQERDRLKMERDDWHKVADDRAAEIVRLTGMLSGEPKQPDETNGGWRPIETVPDPQITPVLGAVPIGDTGDHAVGEMHQTEVGWYWAGNDPSDSWGGQIYPAYWQPLPEPPGSAVNG